MMDTNHIKILHIVQAAGGVERYLQMLFNVIDTAKYQNIVICSSDYDRDYFENNKIEYYVMKLKRSIDISDFVAAIEVRKLIKKISPDIIYCHSSKGGAIGRLANIGLNYKCIYNPHGWAFNMNCNKMKRSLYMSIEKLLTNFCDSIVCISDAEKKSALDNKISPEEKLIVIKNGIDIEKYKHKNTMLRTALNIPEDAYVVGTVARLSKQKAPDIFIRMAEKVKDKIPNAFFVMVGDGEEREEVESFIKNSNLKNSVIITGWIDDAFSYMKNFDVGLLLSRWEGFGLVLSEYMLAQTPIIATSVDAIPYIIENEKNGLLVKVDDITETTKAVIRLHNDIDLSNKMITNAFKEVNEKYDIKRVSIEHQELIERILL
ncbi:glycosyltransferase family 4 protein [Clostridium sp. AL.422]|uniref:glycosyltransferase family 4 protein n=1 Tax=Clostridium TaxID=1485 RepID=UPI00293DF0BD|nr:MULTISPECIES: glycosyltransferase family 4 protein [unclassified Clostridium]MDV4150295.1 glycosyltransferase family 4 protein [Clostridium sp. AL.422]